MLYILLLGLILQNPCIFNYILYININQLLICYISNVIKIDKSDTLFLTHFLFVVHDSYGLNKCEQM